MLDLSIYLDISDEVKFAWKVQRDMQERGHSLESIKASIEGRKPDFEAFVRALPSEPRVAPARSPGAEARARSRSARGCAAAPRAPRLRLLECP